MQRLRNVLKWPFTWVVLVLAVAVGYGYADWHNALPPEALERATYVGRQRCADCHQVEHEQWLGSHHDQAMQPANDETVLGDFNDATYERLGASWRFFRRDGQYYVNAEGPDGENHDYEIKYTFGVDPLQQYMVEFPDGRVQVLSVAWDVARKEWFFVPPPDAPNDPIDATDPMHWTGVANNWNTMCADCHSTDLHKNYDPATDTYATKFAEIDVSCEACHGPGSVHVELATAHSLFWDRNVGYGLPRLKSPNSRIEIESCAPCHSRRSMIKEGFRPGHDFHDYFAPSLLREGLYHADGQILDEVYVYGSFLQSRMHGEGVRCTDCHNPHSLELKFPGNQLCGQCHVPGKYDTPTHHHHTEGTPGAQCVECHMPSSTYMVVDPRRDHSLRIPRPDLTVTEGTPNACNGCHTKKEESAEWAAAQIRDWVGAEKAAPLHWTAAITAGRRRAEGADKLLIDVLENKKMPALVQATAAELLGGLATPDAQAALRKQLKKKRGVDPAIRTAAAASYPATEAADYVRMLGPLLVDPHTDARIAAANRLVDVPPQYIGRRDQRHLKAALDEYRDAQEIYQDRAAGELNLGSLARCLGDPQTAAEHFRRAIEREPYLTGPRSELAAVLPPDAADEANRLRAEELTNLKRDIELLPDSGPTYYRLGLTHYLLGQLDEAEQALSKATELAPNAYEFLTAPCCCKSGGRSTTLRHRRLVG